MRRFSDAEGRTWDVVLGRESWGTLYALFVPAGVGRDEPIRQALLSSSGYDQAQRELEAMDESQLLRLLDNAETRNP